MRIYTIITTMEECYKCEKCGAIEEGETEVFDYKIRAEAWDRWCDQCFADYKTKWVKDNTSILTKRWAEKRFWDNLTFYHPSHWKGFTDRPNHWTHMRK